VKKAFYSGEIDLALYQQRYPDLAQLATDANRNSVRRNLGWRCGELLRRAPPVLQSKDNALLRDDELVWKSTAFRLDHAGFDPIPFEQIGLYRDGTLRP
jgi:hypothetical protein